MATFRINEVHLRLIRRRQEKQAWGKNYIASQWATKAEAPGLSTASILYPKKLGRRAFHTLSMNEAWVALLLLYHPRLWDLHEQKMLHPNPLPHPLQGHERALGMTFMPMKGTLSIAEEMGMLSRHPRCKVKLEDGTYGYSPFPFLGDLLAYFDDEQGPYVVNVSVKDKFESFRSRGPRPGKPDSNADNLGAINRHTLERRYYEDAGIPTRQAVGKAIDIQLRANLVNLFQFHSEEIAVPYDTKIDVWSTFSSYVGSQVRAYTLVERVAHLYSIDPEVAKTLLIQGIWNRAISVDLFKPVLMDRPLRPMAEDPLDVYSLLFARG